VAGGLFLAAVIYGLAFSRWGAATQTATERPPHRRSHQETLLHLTAATSFSLTAAVSYEWLRRRAARQYQVEIAAAVDTHGGPPPSATAGAEHPATAAVPGRPA
jgi:hypothetical protein